MGLHRRSIGIFPVGWMDNAACVGHDPALWTTEHDSEKIAAAAAICMTCPVLAECEEFIRSLPYWDRWGVWAGRNWIGGPEPSKRLPGHCAFGHLRAPGNRQCLGCEKLVRDAANALGVTTKEYAEAFGRSAGQALKVLRELGLEP